MNFFPLQAEKAAKALQLKEEKAKKAAAEKAAKAKKAADLKAQKAKAKEAKAVSYTHLTLPTIYSV